MKFYKAFKKILKEPDCYHGIRRKAWDFNKWLSLKYCDLNRGFWIHDNGLTRELPYIGCDELFEDDWELLDRIDELCRRKNNGYKK